MMRRSPALALGSVVVACVAGGAQAQTGAALLMQPWQRLGEGEAASQARFEIDGSARFQGESDIDDTDEDLRLYLYESAGRVKLVDEPGAQPAIGYEVLHIDLSTDDPALPTRLSDSSVAAAVGTRRGDWEFGLVGGVGYAGVTPYSDWHSTYFLADLIASYRIDDRSALQFNLNYNGNRNILPDVPLPAISYFRNSEVEGLRYVVGFPYSNVNYRPDARWEFDLRYSVPLSFEARVGYNLAENLQIFGEFDAFTRGFWIEDDPGDNDRLFFSQKRLELGVEYGARQGIDLVLAGGWAFDQEFESGWDLRDTDEVREVDSAFYLRVAFDVAF